MICIPIKQKNISLLLKDLGFAQNRGEMVEIWFDELGKNMSNENLSKIFNKNKKPIIYKFTGNKNIFDILIKTKKIDFIDVDIKIAKTIISEIKRKSPNTKIIISSHNFSYTPDIKVVRKTINKMYKLGADIAKIATYAKNELDSLKVLSLLSEISSSGKKIIAISMGEKGRLTRICGHLFGNYLMYAPLRLSAKTADGQLTANELRKIMNINK